MYMGDSGSQFLGLLLALIELNISETLLFLKHKNGSK